jgi:hypothetical protein
VVSNSDVDHCPPADKCHQLALSGLARAWVMSSTCRRFALHDAGGLQRMGEGTLAGTRGNDKVAPIPAVRGIATQTTGVDPKPSLMPQRRAGAFALPLTSD